MSGDAPGLSWVEARPLLNTLHLPAQALPHRSVCTDGAGGDSEPGVSFILFCLFGLVTGCEWEAKAARDVKLFG